MKKKLPPASLKADSLSIRPDLRNSLTNVHARRLHKGQAS